MELREKSHESFESSENNPETTKRGQWGAKLDFYFSMIGYSVGLGNIWRFPYLCMRNGGGAFLIPFVFFLIACGFPLYFMEVAVGQFTGKGCFHVWEACPLFKGIGVGMFNQLFLITIYYILINAWTMFYMTSSFLSPLPWTSCDNEWNTPRCIREDKGGPSYNNETTYNMSISISTTNVNESYDLQEKNGSLTSWENQTSEKEFWFNRVLGLSDGLHDINYLNWRLTLCFLATWVIVCLCLIKGVKSLGKVVYVTATLPYILLAVILIKGLTLPGALEGVIFYIRPDFHKLASVQVWLEAGLQVFYSLGPCWGCLYTMSSYNKFNNNCYKDTIILVIISEFTSIFGGFAIFTIIGYMAHTTGTPIEKVVQGGPGLAYLVYPEGLSQLPFPNVWAFLFFVMLFTVGLDTEFATLETCLTAICDNFPRLRRYKALTTVLSCCVFFLAGLIMCSDAGLYIFQLSDWYATAFATPLFGLLEAILFGWIYGAENLSRDIELMLGRRVPVYMRILWCIVTPALLMIMLIFTIYQYTPPRVGDYEYPAYARAIGWCIALFPLLPLPICAIKAIIEAKGSTLYEKFVASLRPSVQWHPVSASECEKYDVENRQVKGSLKSKILLNLLGKRS
ncbi:sodium- and chloride-dependent betaine transporter-like [Ostrea edulis]|uniref:sodium- and chloride-dependent betaine transporter-like n=1 Tax=Ostrea edulis TaxID=37623 RepID=UPI0024AF9837|nr:sodium- and chloride-dependent betaine transporter-like [Ostrea edulis]